jgi:uncharacterized protein (TIGR00255 family)
MSVAYSMTGFATVQAHTTDEAEGGASFTFTLKSVNHRFLDLALRLPHNTDELEVPIRRMVKDAVRRGHVDVTLQVARSESTMHVQLNRELLAAHVHAYREAAAQYGVTAAPDLNAILRHPGVLRAEAGVSELPATFHADVLALLPALLERLNETRAQEGASLVAELCAAMHRLRVLTAEVTMLRADVRSSYVERLRARMAELLEASAVNHITDDRLLSEAALLAERSNIDEELVRLDTHTARFLTLLDEGGELGKRLDFLLQELNREANTLLSKTSGATAGNGLRITDLGLEMKHEIEKAREQVQNLE